MASTGPGSVTEQKETGPIHGDDLRSQIPENVRAGLSQQPGGGYAAGPLGSLLAKLGLDANARKPFLSEVRGVRTLGSGPDKRYLFSS